MRKGKMETNLQYQSLVSPLTVTKSTGGQRNVQIYVMMPPPTLRLQEKGSVPLKTN